MKKVYITIAKNQFSRFNTPRKLCIEGNILYLTKQIEVIIEDAVRVKEDKLINFEFIILWLLLIVNKKKIIDTISTKSQFHQPPQSNSCCAHHEPNTIDIKIVTASNLSSGLIDFLIKLFLSINKIDFLTFSSMNKIYEYERYKISG